MASARRLDYRHDCATDDGHAQDARSLAGVLCPGRRTASVKMVGNMMELNRPTASTAHIDRWPEKHHGDQGQSPAKKALKARTLTWRQSRRMTAAPMNRPTMAPPQ